MTTTKALKWLEQIEKNAEILADLLTEQKRNGMTAVPEAVADRILSARDAMRAAKEFTTGEASA